MTTRLVLLPYVQAWDGAALQVRLLLIPRGNPLDPLTTGAPAFPDARLVLDVHVVPGLDTMPTLGGAPTVTITEPVVATATPLFKALAAQMPIDPTPPPPVTRPSGTAIKKHLPTTYQDAVGYTRGRTPLVFIDDTYSCARTSPTPRPYVKLVPPTTVPWGKVVAALLRQPTLSEGAGLVRALSVTVDPSTVKDGGWIYVTLSPTSDGAALLGTPDGLKVYTARIPVLSGPRPIFTPVFFPVTTAPPPGPYDDLFAEVEDYDDGFAKAVHGAQPQHLDPLNETPDGSRPAKELGIRLGWDDEQVTIWLNRQIDPAAASLDAPMGVQGYRVDVRETGTVAWHSLTHASGPVQVPPVDLGTFDGELGVETHPVQLHGEKTGDYWLPTYFTSWTGPSLVTLDTDTIRLAGGPDKSGAARVTGTVPDVPLRYGTTYDFRVRLMDHTGGGPALSGVPAVPGPAPVGTVAFRRWIRPLGLALIDPPPPTPDPTEPPTTLTVTRPLLHHPAVVCTGAYADPIADLLADLPVAKAEGREVGLPDPDVDRVLVVVEAQGLAQDPIATDGGFQPIYQTTRPFPADLHTELTLDLDWVDVTDVATLSSPPATGALPIPTARTVRIRLSALGKDDPHLAYFGADDVRYGPARSVTVRKDSGDERSLLAPDLPSHRFAAFFLQPDLPVDASVLFAQRAAGIGGVRPSDAPTRLAAALGLRNDGLTLRSRPGRRVVFGCSPKLRHVIGPDNASLSFASTTDLTQHWLVVVRLTLARDWTWDGLAGDGIVVVRDGVEVGRFGPNHNVGVDALTDPDRTSTDLVFIDAIDPKPGPGGFPEVLHPHYTVTANLVGSPTEDPPLDLDVRLPVTTPPAQRVKIVSAGLALSPYVRSDDYSSTEPRQRALWLELDRAPDDPNDRYFARVLRVAPDPILSAVGDSVPDSAEPPLPIDPELIRTIVAGQSEDEAGLDAMQQLLPSDSPVHFMLPLPPGMDDTAPELFGFFTYELRVGHKDVWSTAQGRFGTPLRVTGVQHPAPELSCMVLRNSTGVTVSAPFALPVLDGRPVQPVPPHSEIWVLLYAQAEQVDGEDRRNVLLTRKPALWSRQTFELARASNEYGSATFGDAEIRLALDALGFRDDASLSVVAIELLPNGVRVPDPLGGDLGSQRVLRTSPLTPVPAVC